MYVCVLIDPDSTLEDPKINCIRTRELQIFSKLLGYNAVIIDPMLLSVEQHITNIRTRKLKVFQNS